MPKAYYITNWDTDRENAETRKYVDLLWFRNKVKLMGEGLGHTLAAPNNRGPHLYGMFKLIEQVAAGGRLEQRGWLFRNGSPMDAQRIANLLRLPVADVEEALTFFSTPPMNWLELKEYPGDSPSKPANPPHAGRLPGDSPSKPANPPHAGRLPGDSPSKTAEAGKPREIAGRNAASEEHPYEPTVVQQPENKREREEKGGILDGKELRARQTAQFAAANAQLLKLEAVPREERTEAMRTEIKKTRGLINAIQKKQARNDFTPVEETK